MPSAMVRRVRDVVWDVGEIVVMCRDLGGSLRHRRPSWPDFLSQMHFVGVKSQTVVLTTGAATGMVLCAQTFFQFFDGLGDVPVDLFQPITPDVDVFAVHRRAVEVSKHPAFAISFEEVECRRGQHSGQ